MSLFGSTGCVIASTEVYAGPISCNTIKSNEPIFTQPSSLTTKGSNNYLSFILVCDCWDFGISGRANVCQVTFSLSPGFC